MEKQTHRLIFITAIAALVGLVDTIYLTISHYGGKEVACSIVEGCSLVLASSWASIFGISTAMIGGVFYLFVLLLVGLFLYYRNEALLLSLMAVATVAFMVSLGFLYLQIFVIGALCEYCLLSLAATTVIWIASLAQIYIRR